jgi:hypothetical protein
MRLSAFDFRSDEVLSARETIRKSEKKIKNKTVIAYDQAVRVLLDPHDSIFNGSEIDRR